MNCKWRKVVGNTTKHWHCTIKGQAVDDYKCRDCMLRIPDLPEGFEEIFGKGFRR